MHLESKLIRSLPLRRMAIVLPIVLLVLGLAFRQGRYPSLMFLIRLVAMGGLLVLLRDLELGLYALVVVAFMLPMQFGTGTEVTLNLATLLIPTLCALWLIVALHRGELQVQPSRTYRPLLLFLGAGLLSLGLGDVLWDPIVPQPRNIILVQLGQWGIFALAGGAYFLGANLLTKRSSLQRLVFFYLIVVGGLAVLRVLPKTGSFFNNQTTGAVDRAPFWLLLMAIGLGQLLYNRTLSWLWRVFLVAVIASVLYFCFKVQLDVVSNWVGVVTVAGVLIWLRFPRLRWGVVPALAALIASGVLYRALFSLAGGESEWEVSGGSRLALIGRVIEVTMRNPITGLGPASYRHYAAMRPLGYEGAYWIVPAVNSHNNYVDLFAHVGVLGLGLCLWWLGEIGLLGGRLNRLIQDGFLAGFTNGMVAALAGVLAIMALADWMLPHVYNIGFHGFQAAALVWLFLGALVAVEHMPREG